MGNIPMVGIGARLEIRNSLFDADFEVSSRFFFENDTELPEKEEAAQFVNEYGLEYAFGYIRAALADDLRIFGFPAGIMPVTALDTAKASGVNVAYH
ncbi:hypothetical protein [Nocardia sp. alder85J]|uniref:hypothetical protein n=1 Tax=Nocardia sp. alder85J TaxID=2862949 RepID=UPI001CD434E0|nr:hypothetical protein [Nocardia sp. alder85J]MCX4095303.1 hypothetical protein [Nocardia sp. alder85J]